MFERYVNFEFYKTYWKCSNWELSFERYVNFEFYKTNECKNIAELMFERYVNFEFYKTFVIMIHRINRLRDM